jgi:hypothetical protein
MTAVLTVARSGIGGGWMDSCYGWRSEYQTPLVNGISKYAFFSDTDAVATGDLAINDYSNGWGQSQTKGYNFGAYAGYPSAAKVKAFTFASGADQALVGDLQIGRYGCGGTNGSA